MPSKPTLVILAAGLGSRFGGNKQTESLGSGGETIMDYSVYDAIRAGFGKVVFVIRESFRADFIRKFNAKRFCNLVQVEYVCQETDKLPEGFAVNENRSKPWGTMHALLMSEQKVKEAFASVNADDFYGKEAFEAAADFLRANCRNENRYCVMGYKIENTLTDSGGTSRAECMADKDNYLTFVEERTNVRYAEGFIRGLDRNKVELNISKDAIVSMNFWGFTPDFFRHGNRYFKEFLHTNQGSTSAELLIPTVVNGLIKEQKSSVKVLGPQSEWFGITYQKDIAFVKEKLIELSNKGLYPSPLWSK